MAASEVYDFVSTVTPDYASTLSITPQETLVEQGVFAQKVYIGDDGSEERLDFSSGVRIFYVVLNWEVLSESDAGTIFDWYFDTAKAHGMIRSFKWESITDNHTYVVRFATRLQRDRLMADIHRIFSVKLRILGRIAD